MKHDIRELEGPLLDAAVAMAEGLPIDSLHSGQCIVGAAPNRYVFSPSRKWEHGGPIIERERIWIWFELNQWKASRDIGSSSPPIHRSGQTPLIAAMRAFASSELGDEIDLP